MSNNEEIPDNVRDTYDRLGIPEIERKSPSFVEMDGERRAAAIHVLLTSKGYPDSAINEWWNEPSRTLGGSTPTFVWLRHFEGDRNDVELLAGEMPLFGATE
jgi:hypothetical protein